MIKCKGVEDSDRIENDDDIKSNVIIHKNGDESSSDIIEEAIDCLSDDELFLLPMAVLTMNKDDLWKDLSGITSIRSKQWISSSKGGGILSQPNNNNNLNNKTTITVVVETK